MMQLARRRHPGPLMPADLDLSSQAWRQHPLMRDVAALILPTMSTSSGVRDILSNTVGTGSNITQAANPVTGMHHAYNGSSGYTDFGADSRYAVNSGSITIAAWFRSYGWGSNAMLVSRGFIDPGQSIDYSVLSQNQAGGERLIVAYTKSHATYHMWGSSGTWDALGVFDGNWHLLACSWTYGNLANATVSIDGQAIPGDVIYSDGGPDTDHVPDANDRLVLGANYRSSPGYQNHGAFDAGPVMIWRRELSLAEHWQLYAPQTRWAWLPVRRSPRRVLPGEPPVPGVRRFRLINGRHYPTGRLVG